MKILPWVLLMLAIPAWAQVPQPHMPSCQVKAPYLTKQAHGDLPAGVSDRYDTWAAWICEKPEGYRIEVALFKAASTYQAIVQWMDGKLTEADALADCMQTCVPPTQPELDYMNTLVATYRPRALVAVNGNSPTRSVYALNTDGTLNPTPVAGASVAVATQCTEFKRLPGTKYYSVLGQVNASKPSEGLADVYAVCNISLPLPPN